MTIETVIGRGVPAWRRSVAVIALAATVLIGTGLGVWLVILALAPQAGAEPDDMAGMSAQEMAGMAMPVKPAPEASMAGMSATDMAGMTHDPESGAPGSRPLGVTVTGFLLLNLTVLAAAVVIGRRRRARASGKSAGSRAGTQGSQHRANATASTPTGSLP